MPTPQKFTPSEAARLARAAYRARQAGYRMETIAHAAGVPSPTLAKLIVRQGYPTLPKRYSDPPATLRPIDWHDAPEPGPEALYQRSLVLSLVTGFLANARDLSAINQFAYDANSAAGQGDTAWLRNAEAAVQDAMTYLGRLYAVVTNESERRRGMSDPKERMTHLHLA